MTRRGVEKTANHEIVFAALQKSRKPMTAYDILGRLRGKGIAAPTTVYRALERLMEDGRVHRLESLNAFIACGCAHNHAAVMFSICTACGTAEEIADAKLQSGLNAAAGRAGFSPSHTIVEMHGLCRDCAPARPD